MPSNHDNVQHADLAHKCFNLCFDLYGTGRGRELGNRLFLAFEERGLTGLAREMLSSDFDKARIRLYSLIACSGVDFDTLMTRARIATGKYPKRRTAVIKIATASSVAA